MGGAGAGHGRAMAVFAGGLVVTLAAVVGLLVLWPDGDDGDTAGPAGTVAVETSTELETTVSGALGEPSERTTTTTGAPVAPPTFDLFESRAEVALADLRAASGNPSQGIEIVVYEDYAFLAYRDPHKPQNIDRRMWRAGEVEEASPNPIDDRVDGDTEPLLFPLDAIDLRGLARLTADAPARFDLDVAVTHVIINRFLPFDERVLIRVYARPVDGRSGGGYVQYTVKGTFVKVVQ